MPIHQDLHYLNQHGEAAATSGSSSLPVGVVLPYALSTAPTGFLLCSGQAVSRTTYAALFAAIGTTYGSGDGSTTFNVPDCRGRAIIGLDDLGGSAASRVSAATSLGQTGGAESTSTPPAHTHTKQGANATFNLQTGVTPIALLDQTNNNTGSTGSSPMSLMNPYIAMGAIISY